jgi:class 3 adenylate cyclase
VHRADCALFDLESVQAAARMIPGARYVELPGRDDLPYIGDADALLDVVQEFLTGTQAAPDSDRSLTTVLFTDMVGSTQKADQLGDLQWRYLLDEHHARIRRLLDRFRGEEVDTAGDGFFATFDGPARAIRCACAMRDAVREIGIEIRAGLHTGEVEQGKGGDRPGRPRRRSRRRPRSGQRGTGHRHRPDAGAGFGNQLRGPRPA